MKYLKKFDTHSDYETFKQSSEYIEPNVSVLVNENKVYFNSIGPHEYVDLGLKSGTLWATENIKDTNGNELYFAWGETQGYTSGQVGTDKNFSFDEEDNDYAFGPIDMSDRTNYGMTKYNKMDNKTELDATDDAATVNWGSNWKMPTKEQFEELIANTTTAWTQVDGVNGLLFTSNVNANTLFFPAVGEVADHGVIYGIGDIGSGWFVSLSNEEVNCAYFFLISRFDCNANGSSGRYCGRTVRPVRVETNLK